MLCWDGAFRLAGLAGLDLVATIFNLHPAHQFMNAIGIIGGSGLYAIEGIENCEEFSVRTPFGPPSDKITGGTLAGRQVFFLPRHGKGHRILPTELNHRANIWALRSLGVRWIIAVTAVGSLKEEYHPRDVLLPDQFFDRTSRREHHTFFGRGIVGHVSFADPISTGLRTLLAEEATAAGARVHNGGTYVNMDGPAFSTRAESNANRQLGFDVIGMTNLPEAKLAREAEIALATLAMITDYDCWKVEDEPVTAEAVVAHLHANVAMAKTILGKVIPRIPKEASWPEHSALNGALMTDRSLWPEQTVEDLRPILGRFLQ
jgi:5'-methylthioadenosine phosphorylase